MSILPASACEIQKVLDLLELELQTAVAHHVGAGS